MRKHAGNTAGFHWLPLSIYFLDRKKYSVTDKHISRGLKTAALALNYPSKKGIPIERIDTHSLRSGGANALALAGYSDTQIQKMGRWRGATFKEYIREQLACYSHGMSKSMKKRFNFVNVEGGVWTDVTNTVVAHPYNANAAAA